MPFLISTETLAAGWENAQNIGRQLKAGAESLKAATAAGPVPRSRVLSYEREIRSFRDRLVAIAAVSGMAAYVEGLPNTPANYDAAAEFTAMRTQIDATITWIRNNFPTNGTPPAGTLLERTWGAEGPTELTFTTAQTAGLRTQLDTLIAAIG